MKSLSRIEFLIAKKEIIEEYWYAKQKRIIEEAIANLIRMSKLIFSLHKDLYHLEIEGKQNSIKFDIEFHKLEALMKVDEGYYTTSSTEIGLVDAIITQIYEGLIDGSLLDKLKFGDNISLYDATIIINRVISTLDYIRANQAADNFVDPSLNSTTTDFYVDTEIAKNYLKILQDGINDNLNHISQVIKMDGTNHCIKKMKWSKYIESFMYLDIEKSMLKSRFDIKTTTFIDSNSSTLFNSDYNAAIRRDVIMSNAEETMMNILDYSDNSLIDIDNKVELIKAQYKLRSALLMLDDEAIDYLSSIYKEIACERSNMNNNNCSISERMLFDALENVRSDREKYLPDSDKVRK